MCICGSVGAYMLVIGMFFLRVCFRLIRVGFSFRYGLLLPYFVGGVY